MEEAVIPSEETWQAVVCRLCAHRFEVLITCPEDVQITLCQFCTILVEWFGLPEEAQSLAASSLGVGQPTLAGQAPAGAPVLQAELLPEPIASEPEPVVKVPKKARRRAQLAGLLDQWGDLWRSSQEEE